MKNKLGYFVLLVSTCCFSQNVQLGKVTKSELELKKYEKDTSATAVYLFKKAITKFQYFEERGFCSVTSNQIKLKILKKDGLNLASVKIPFYVGYKFLEQDAVKEVNAIVYNLENGSITQNKLSGKGKFEQNQNEYWSTLSVVFPNVKVGSIIEFTYTLESDNIFTLPEFDFQENIPVAYAEYVTQIPQIYSYLGMKYGLPEVLVTKKAGFETYSFENKFHQSGYLDFPLETTTYKALDVPSFENEPFCSNASKFCGRISHELQYVIKSATEVNKLALSWEDVSKSVYKENNFGKEIEKYQYFENDLSQIINDNLTEFQKIETIFSFVQQRMTWNEKKSIFTSEGGVSKAYENRTGNSADINLMLVGMLNHFKISAFAGLSTTLGSAVADFPNRTSFDFVMAFVQIDGQWVPLDATSKLSKINFLPTRDLNGNGHTISKIGQTFTVSLLPEAPSTETTYFIGELDIEGKISGKTRRVFNNSFAMEYLQNQEKMNETQYKEQLEKKWNANEITEFSKTLEPKNTITEVFSISQKSSMDVIGNKFFFGPLLFFAETSNPFKAEKRKYPIDIIFPKQKNYSLSITFPKEYAIESLPKPVNLKMPDNLGSFQFNCVADGTKVQITMRYYLNKCRYDASDYDLLKTFFKIAIDKQAEKIVLVKK